jgi:short-subunit dehydrogenase
MAKLFEGKTVLITGASAGIGEALARSFARHGAKVVLTARRADRLDALRDAIVSDGGQALAVACDVTSRESLDAAMQQAVEVFGGIDVVVANAGFGVSGAVTKLETEDFRRQFETNVFGLIDTAYAALPHLVTSKGRLGLVGSVMGRVGLPASAPYCASKYAVNGFADSIYYDLADRGVAVTTINPGLVASELRSVNNRGEYTGKKDPAPQWLVMPAEKAAEQIVRGLYKCKPEVVVTRLGKLIIFLNRHFPWLVRFALRQGSKGKLDKVEAAKRGAPTEPR